MSESLNSIIRLKTAAEFVREGLSLSVGDVLLRGDNDNDNILCIVGWSHSILIENMTQKSALDELAEIKIIFNEMLKICPDLIKLTGKNQVKICLSFNYGMGAIEICSSLNGVIFWNINLKP